MGPAYYQNRSFPDNLGDLSDFSQSSPLEKAVAVLGAVGKEAEGSSSALRPIFQAFLNIRACLSSSSLHRDQSEVQASVGGGSNSSISHRISRDRFLGTATSVIWNVT
jgi:hypothetical protein